MYVTKYHRRCLRCGISTGEQWILLELLPHWLNKKRGCSVGKKRQASSRFGPTGQARHWCGGAPASRWCAKKNSFVPGFLPPCSLTWHTLGAGYSPPPHSMQERHPSPSVNLTARPKPTVISSQLAMGACLNRPSV